MSSVCNMSYSSLDIPISALTASGMENFSPVFEVNLGHCTTVKVHLPVSPDKVREETLRDSVLQEVRKFHLERWPSKIRSTELQQLF